MKQIYLLAFSLMLAGGTAAQVTLDDFNDGMTTGWAPPSDGANFHTYNEANGELQINYDVTEPTWYSRSTFTLANPVDMSNNNIIRVAMRTQNLSQTLSVRLDLIDGNTYTTNGVPFELTPIVADGNIAIYEWNMTGRWNATFWNGSSGLWQVDSTNVTALEFFINANTVAGQDSIWLDYIEVDSVLQGTGGGDGDISFSVDMNSYGGTFTGVFVNSSLNNWCGTCWPLTDANMDGIWEGTVTDQVLGNHEYLFTVDGWTDKEVLQGANAYNCANQFNNRVLALAGDTVLATVCWESCTDCASDPCIGATPDANFITDAECNFNAVYNDWEAGWWWLPNPDMSGINPSPGVYSYTKYVNDGIVRAVSTEAPLDLTMNNQFKMDVWQNLNNNMLVLVQPLDIDSLPTLGNYFDTLTTTSVWEGVNIDMSDNTNSTVIGFHFFIGVGDMSTLNEQLFVDNIRLDGYISPQSIEENNAAELMVYPNPATDQLTVITATNGSISMYDLTGRMVLNDNTVGTVRELSTADLARGAYLVEVVENGVKRNTKVILE